jgi:hypothetical protein
MTRHNKHKKTPKIRKTKKQPSEWNLYTSRVFKQGRLKNKNYSFKQALIDAGKTYKKKGGTTRRNQ